MTKDEVLKLTGSFTWMWDHQFFIETKKGNFIWSNPGYHGDNSLTPSKQTYRQFLIARGVPYGRDKGIHTIESYCGTEVTLVES